MSILDVDSPAANLAETDLIKSLDTRSYEIVQRADTITFIWTAQVFVYTFTFFNYFLTSNQQQILSNPFHFVFSDLPGHSITYPRLSAEHNTLCLFFNSWQ